MAGINENKFDIELVKALSDEVRIEILNILGLGELNVQEIADKSSVSRPNVSHHLQILKRSGLVASRKEGKEVYYSIRTDKILGFAEVLLRFISSGKL